MNKLARVLLVDDDIEQHELVKISMPALAELDCVSSATQALKILKKNSYDMIVIDINLADENGFIFLENLKKLSLASHSIKIVVTASEREEDAVKSHKYEVDDFVIKPIRPRVFSALIEKHLKKRILSEIWTRGKLKIDLSRLLVEVLNKEAEYIDISLTPREFKILLKLAKHPGHVYTREQIFEEAWKDDGNDNGLRSIDTHISSLRKKLSPFGANLISVRGVGYKLEVD